MRPYSDDPEMMTAESVSSLPLFSQPELRTLARRDNPDTAKEAALGIVDHLPQLQARVYAAFVEHGAMTAKQAERLPEFAELGFSTVRKRCSEGLAMGWLVRTGEICDGCHVLAARK
jgi:hypothetical protein